MENIFGKLPVRIPSSTSDRITTYRCMSYLIYSIKKAPTAAFIVHVNTIAMCSHNCQYKCYVRASVIPVTHF